MLILKPIQVKDNSYRTIAPPLQVQRPVFFLTIFCSRIPIDNRMIPF